MNDFIRFVFEGDAGLTGYSVETTLFVVLLSFVIGQFVGWVYMWTHRSLSYSQTFVASLVVVPVIVALMILLMSGSIAVAFGLLAVFAVVRFRNVLKDTRDTVFILWAIMEGLAVGTQRFSTAAVGAVGVAAILLYLRVTAFGSRLRYDAVLTLQLTGDLAGALARLKSILHCHSLRVQVTGERRLTDAGLDLSYRLLLRDPSRKDELRFELQQSKDMENVSLYMREDESEI
jgi:hypothetical protein